MFRSGIANAAQQRRVEHSASQQTEKNTTLFLTTAMLCLYKPVLQHIENSYGEKSKKICHFFPDEYRISVA